jgi:hypothetical protein
MFSSNNISAVTDVQTKKRKRKTKNNAMWSYSFHGFI